MGQSQEEKILLAGNGVIAMSDEEACNSLIFSFENVDKIWHELLWEKKNSAFGRQKFIIISELLREDASFNFGFNP